MSSILLMLLQQFCQVQVAHAMGKPTPKPLDNTGTPPLILRMPVSSDESTVSEDKASFKNVTTAISTVSALKCGMLTKIIVMTSLGS